MKKKRYLFVAMLLILFIVLTYCVSEYYENQVVEVKETFSSNNTKIKYSLERFHEENDEYQMDMYYPLTDNDILNQAISEIFQRYKDEFHTMLTNKIDKKYTLKMSFDYYEKDHYITFVFHIFIDTAGAHPNTMMEAISFDFDSKKIFTIEDLLKKNPNILKVLSQVTYESLKEKDTIVQYSNEEMLTKGTAAKVENFKNFAFDEKYFLIFFNHYEVAPYVAGSFVIRVPYEKLNIF